ncbi:glutathione S-transferase family protein [Microvirga pudoricolor]|uniref:glutathione S-transferase family protein n=1 Tax=Microvirga pudoricolor TaxID=2778729 RepID=UPI00194DB7C1|nr:glutathione S-transferase family protein [Microvirga pudoricolor]MBM6592767.1 glutathione S-transferase family protein [Microvirga pudoricolor]
MLILRSSPASPFGRKVKISASLLGLSDRIEIVPSDTLNPEDSIRQQNPLGKIPALILENGEILYDSRVIIEYLDYLAGGGVIPAGEERFLALRHQALADGIMDAALLQVYEGRFRATDRQEAKWVDHQAEKVKRALAHAEAHLTDLPSTIHVGHIAQACALGYLDLRFAGEWRSSYPKLVAWLDAFASQVPAFEHTKVKA